MKALVITLAVIILILLGILLFYNPAQGPTMPVAGNNTSTGNASTSQMTTSPDGHMVVTSPLASASIASPVAITGTVTGGGWFFEATFPIEIIDANGKAIGHGQAQAQSDWTATGTVPFKAMLTFTKPQTATGDIVFSKDNPSGDPKNDESFTMPVSF